MLDKDESYFIDETEQHYLEEELENETKQNSTREVDWDGVWTSRVFYGDVYELKESYKYNSLSSRMQTDNQGAICCGDVYIGLNYPMY